MERKVEIWRTYSDIPASVYKKFQKDRMSGKGGENRKKIEENLQRDRFKKARDKIQRLNNMTKCTK